jgi:hypothetical protein
MVVSRSYFPQKLTSKTALNLHYSLLIQKPSQLQKNWTSTSDQTFNSPYLLQQQLQVPLLLFRIQDFDVLVKMARTHSSSCFDFAHRAKTKFLE